jgi:hypothetical protein
MHPELTRMLAEQANRERRERLTAAPRKPAVPRRTTKKSRSRKSLLKRSWEALLRKGQPAQP